MVTDMSDMTDGRVVLRQWSCMKMTCMYPLLMDGRQSDPDHDLTHWDPLDLTDKEE